VKHEIKTLVAAMRAAFPMEARDAIITATFVLDDGTTYQLSVDGVPPTDTVQLYRQEDLIWEVANWGAQAIAGVTRLPIEAFQDTPENVHERREVLKNYDNKKNSGRKPK